MVILYYFGEGLAFFVKLLLSSIMHRHTCLNQRYDITGYVLKYMVLFLLCDMIQSLSFLVFFLVY